MRRHEHEKITFDQAYKSAGISSNLDDYFSPEGAVLVKKNWITVALDGNVSDEQIKPLLDWSYETTAPKIRMK